MFIFNRMTGKLYNLDKVTDVFPGKEQGTVSLALDRGEIIKFAKYDTEDEAKEMISMLAEHISVSKGEVFTAPKNEMVKARIKNSTACWHHATGKKTKGHGGS